MKNLLNYTIFLLFLCDFAYAKQIYVAKDGNDSNKGSSERPYLSINKAAQEARPGDEVIIREGVYREWVNPARGGKSEKTRIVYRAEDNHEVRIVGSERVDQWQKDGDIWKVELEQSFFGEVNPFNTLSRHPEYIEEDETSDGWGWMMFGRWTHRGDVFIDGEGLTEVKAKKDLVKPFTWYTETRGDITSIWGNFSQLNPNESATEINVRGNGIFPSRAGINYITVRGLTVQNIANHWVPPTEFQPGAIAPNGGHHWVIEDNNILYAKTVAISLGRPSSKANYKKSGYHVVRNNIIYRPGQAGIIGERWHKSSIIENNIIEQVNYREEFGGWETAGIKFHHGKDIVLKNNLIRGVHTKDNSEAAAHGIWVDYGNKNWRISRNVVIDAERDAILFEANWKGPFLVDNNIFINGQLNTMSSRSEAWVNNLNVNTKPLWKNQDYGNRPEVGNARWYNNINIGFGLDKAPVVASNIMDHNLYLDGARKNSTEENSIELSFDPKFSVDYVFPNIQVTFDFPKLSKEINNPRISPEFLDLSLRPIHQEGMSVERDFHGKSVSSDTFGPFSDIAEGANKFVIYTYPDHYKQAINAAF